MQIPAALHLVYFVFLVPFDLILKLEDHSLESKYNTAAHLRSIDGTNFFFIHAGLFAYCGW